MKRGELAPKIDYDAARHHIQALIVHIRTMLWANDFATARHELRAGIEDYLPDIREALKLKSLLTASDRRTRAASQSVHRKFSPDSKPRESKPDSHVEARCKSSAQDDLFEFSAIAAVLDSLDQRIASVLGLDSIISPGVKTRTHNPIGWPELELDNATGFRIWFALLEEDDAEVRAYRFLPPAIRPRDLWQELERCLDCQLVEIEPTEVESASGWPLSLRGFRKDSYTELTFYSPGRFIASIKSVDPYILRPMADAILIAYAQACRIRGFDAAS